MTFFFERDIKDALRRKKRYILVRNPAFAEGRGQFLFQTQHGHVFKITPAEAEELRAKCLLISGSIRKLKQYKTAK